MITFDDMLDHVIAYAGMDAGVAATTLHRRAIQNAYLVLPTRHNWMYLYGIARVATNASSNSGSIEFDLTGGAFERMVTLTGGTWPSWAALGYIVIANIPYQIDARKSNTVVTLQAATAPTADIAALTTYTLLQDRYALPSDFVAGDEGVVNEIGTVLSYLHPRDWASQRRTNVGPGQPWAFTYIGSPSVRGSLNVAFFPPPDQTYQIDFLYKRAMRPLVYAQVSAGTVSVSAAGTTVTGVGTAFTSGMVGSIIRFGIDNKTVPTGPTGAAPSLVERTITAFTSATSITVGEAIADALTSVKYLISDPIDLDQNTMGEYFQRECEKQWRMIARSKPTPEEAPAYTLSLQQAREADNRNDSRAAAFRLQSRRSGFSHYPINFTG